VDHYRIPATQEAETIAGQGQPEKRLNLNQ
jgi:hypothetical protein